MPKLGGVYITVGAKTNKLKRDLAKAKGMTKKAAVLMNQEIGRISFKQVGVAALAFSATVAFGMKKAIDAASDLEETVGKFDVVFKDHAMQAEKMAGVLVDSYAMSTREAKQYLSSVQDLLVPMGMASDAAIIMSNEVVKLSADLASFNNVPTATAMADIQSALVGNFETMKKYGVVLNETVIKQEALNRGVWDGKGMVDANTKAQLAFQLMLKGSAAAIGDQQRTMSSYANQMKQLRANIEDISAEIGDELLPQMTTWVNQVNISIKQNPEMIKQIGEFAKNVLVLADTMGRVIIFGVEFYNVFVATAQAMGIASTGAASWTEALTNGVEVVKRFNIEQDGLTFTIDKNTEGFELYAKAVEDTGAALDSISTKTVSGKFDSDELESRMILGKEFYGKRRTAILEMNTFEKTHIKKRIEIAKATHKAIFEDMKRMNKLTGREEQIGTEQFKKFQREKLLATGTFFDGFKLGMADSQKDFGTWAEHGVKVSKDLADNASSALSDGFFSVIKGDLDDIGQLWDGFLDSMLKSLTDTVADMAVQWALNAAFASIGNLVDSIGTFDPFGLIGFETGAFKLGTDAAGKAMPDSMGRPGIPIMAHKDEMIVPAGQANLMRDIFEKNGINSFGDFQKFYNANQGTGDPTMDFFGNALLGGLQNQMIKASLFEITAGLSNIGGGFDIGRLINNSVGGGALMSIFTGAITSTFLDELGLLNSNFNKVGGGVGAGAGGLLAGPFGAIVGRLIGSVGGGLAGDFANSRQFEPFLDIIENIFQAKDGNIKGYLNAQKFISSQDFVISDYINRSGGSGGAGNVPKTRDSSLSIGGGFRDGGISTGPESGYFAKLHGTEVIVSSKGEGVPVTVEGNNDSRPINITIQVGNEEFGAYVGVIADDIRVQANRRGLETERIF